MSIDDDATPDSEHIFIPEQSYIPKPWFLDWPDQSVVDEIKLWVMETGKPHEWRGHTHTKPPPGSKPRYIDEFDVPTFGRIVDRIAPCPCCSPRHAKYKRLGKIAWFPDECVIRLIGPKCFRSLDAGAHDDAVAELAARKTRERAIRYLSGSLPRLEAVLDASGDLVDLAYSIDDFRSELIQALSLKKIDLWSHCSMGHLDVYRKELDLQVNATGEIVRREIDVKVEYAPLRGFRMLDPGAKALDIAAKGVRSAFQRSVEQIKANPDVTTWSDQFRTQALKTYSKARSDALRLAKEMSDLLQFVGPSALPTLRTWGARHDATLNLFVERSGRDLWIGPNAQDKVRVDIRPTMLRVVPEFDAIDPGVEKFNAIRIV